MTSLTDNTYEDFRRVTYGEGATFVPVCNRCGRFVKSDATIFLSGDGQPKGKNATCAKCGRVAMPFEGWM